MTTLNLQAWKRASAGGWIVSAWQPIETAPRDGRRFIAWDARNHYCLFTMHWDDDEFLTDNERWSGRVTHWMPLPEPPK